MAVEPHKHCPVCGTPIPMNEKHVLKNVIKL